MIAGVVTGLRIAALGIGVKREGFAQVEPLGDEIEFLDQLEIALQYARLGLAPPQGIERRHGIAVVDRSSGIVRPLGIVPYLVNVRGIACHVIEQVVGRDIGPLATLDPPAQVDTRLDELEDRKVEVRTQIVALVGTVRPGIAVLHIVKTLLIEVIQHHVVAGDLGTAAKGDIAVDGITGIAQCLVVPIDIGTRPIPVSLQLLVVIGRRPTPLVVADGLVVKRRITVRIERLGEGRGLLKPETHRGADGCRGNPAAFGFNPNHAVGTPFAENGQRSSVLEDRHAFDLRRREVGNIAGIHFEAVDKDFSRIVTGITIRPDTADQPAGRIVTRLARPLKKCQTRKLPGKTVGQVGCGRLAEGNPVDGRNGPRCASLGCPEECPRNRRLRRVSRIGRRRLLDRPGGRCGGQRNDSRKKQWYNDEFIHNRICF